MLAYADAQFAARDSAIPGLRVLLDPDAFACALRRRLPAVNLGAVRPTYLRYKAGTNCLVAYQLDVAGAQVGLYAKARRQQSTNGKTGAALSRGVTGPIGVAGFILDEARAAVYAFPNDRRLEALAGVADAHTRERLLRAWVPRCPSLWSAALQELHYKPERRFVGRMTSADGNDAVLRVYAECDYDAASRAARAFESRGPLRVARVLGGSDRHRTVVLPWLAGQSLYDVVLDSTTDRGWTDRVAAALAELHAQEARSLASPDPAVRHGAIRASADAVAAVCPWLGVRARRLADRLMARLSAVTPLNRAIHGDFSADQLVLGDDAVAVIDLDGATRGDPEVDLGSFAADLEREVVRATISSSRAQAIIIDLLDSYRRASGHDPHPRFQMYFANALLGHAVSPFRNHMADWPAKVEFLLARAEEAARH